jgi:hypothetical protein
MGIYREVFGPSKEDIWRQLSGEIGARYVEGGFWQGDKVQAQIGEWTVTLDTHEVPSGGTKRATTRIRAPFVNQDGFNFLVYRSGVFSELGKLMGMQDVEVGFPEFDSSFIIKGNNKELLRRLFSNEKIRQLLSEQPNVRFEIISDEGGSAGESTDEVRFQASGAIQDLDRLKQLFELFAVTLDQLCAMGSAYCKCSAADNKTDAPQG